MAVIVFDRHDDRSRWSVCLSAGSESVSNTINSCPGANTKWEREREAGTTTHTHSRTHTIYSISQSTGVWQSLQSGKAHTLTPSDPPNNFRVISLNALHSSQTPWDRDRVRLEDFHSGFAACCCAVRSGLSGIHCKNNILNQCFSFNVILGFHTTLVKYSMLWPSFISVIIGLYSPI